MGVILGLATLPPHTAEEEAWMSINPLHRIAARLRFLLNLTSLGSGGKR
jgi:hypothetical protein